MESCSARGASSRAGAAGDVGEARHDAEDLRALARALEEGAEGQAVPRVVAVERLDERAGHGRGAILAVALGARLHGHEQLDAGVRRGDGGLGGGGHGRGEEVVLEIGGVAALEDEGHLPRRALAEEHREIAERVAGVGAPRVEREEDLVVDADDHAGGSVEEQRRAAREIAALEAPLDLLGEVDGGVEIDDAEAGVAERQPRAEHVAVERAGRRPHVRRREGRDDQRDPHQGEPPASIIEAIYQGCAGRIAGPRLRKRL